MNEIDLLRQQTADIAEQLNAQVGQLVLAQAAQKGAWVMLLRHLSAQGYANLGTVQKDLEVMAEAQEDEALQGEYAMLVDAVQMLRGIPSAQP